MKNISIILLFLIFTNSWAQETQLIVKYDKAGNVIERKIQVMPQVNLKKLNIIKDTLVEIPFKVYPNPTNLYLNIDGKLPENIKEAELYLYTLSGVLIKKDIYQGQLKTLNVGELVEGLYLLEIIFSEKKTQNYKIIITN